MEICVLRGPISAKAKRKARPEKAKAPVAMKAGPERAKVSMSTAVSSGRGRAEERIGRRRGVMERWIVERDGRIEVGRKAISKKVSVIV